LTNIAAFEARLDILEGQIGKGPWVLGRHFTLADILVGHILYRWFDMDIPRRSRPVIEHYYERLTRRRAYRDHVMVPYDALWADGA